MKPVENGPVWRKIKPMGVLCDDGTSIDLFDVGPDLRSRILMLRPWLESSWLAKYANPLGPNHKESQKKIRGIPDKGIFLIGG